MKTIDIMEWEKITDLIQYLKKNKKECHILTNVETSIKHN